MAITLSSTKITTASVNTSVSANFAGPVDFSSAVISGESDKWQIVSADSNLSVNRNYFANTTGTGDATGIAMTLTLPASANVGDTITVIDQTANAQSNNVVIARNGNPIDGANRNVILNVQRGGVRLVYTGYGWTTKKVERETRFSGAQGEVSGYVSGGYDPGISTESTDIDKYPFATDTNATDVGDLTKKRRYTAGQSSLLSGYVVGGLYQGSTFEDRMDKFSFSNEATSTDIGNLSLARQHSSGQSSDVSGYTSGGEDTPSTISNVIDKFPFSTDTNATDIADLSAQKRLTAGQSSKVNGYVSAALEAPGPVNKVDKFPFSVDVNATDVLDLSVARSQSSGQSSTTHGYSSGGGSPAVSDVIDKFPFASDNNASDVGNLTGANRLVGGGNSSTTNGYHSGGFAPIPAPSGPGDLDRIDKFPFASDNDATDIGNLSTIKRETSGQQS
jgi:hypothetical protein